MVLGKNPAEITASGKSAPVEQVSWEDCQGFRWAPPFRVHRKLWVLNLRLSVAHFTRKLRSDLDTSVSTCHQRKKRLNDTMYRLKHPLRPLLVFIGVASFSAAENFPGSDVPDLTKGGELTRINRRWVGPVGIHCGAWRPDNRRYEEQLQFVRQLLVLEIEKGSPADGMLAVGDVILGADGTGAESIPMFEGGIWPMIPIADAITEAEARDPALLKLLIWRPADKGGDPNAEAIPKEPSLDDVNLGTEPLGGIGGLDDLRLGSKTKDAGEKKAAKDGGSAGHRMTVTIPLELLGRYSETAPYDCEKSRRILRKGIQAIYEANDPGRAGFQLLCLLAADDPTHPDNDKYQARAREWAHQLEPGGNPWFSGAKLIVLSEYYMKTKDEAIFPKLVEAAETHARGVSWFGTTGHRFAELQPDMSYGGRIAGYGPINCSGALGFLGLSLARKAGVQSPVVAAANRRQVAFFGHFALRSGIGYGEHPYALAGGLGDINGKGAMSGLALGLQEGKEAKAKFFCAKAATSTYSQRQYAHGGSYFGQVMHPIGAAQGGVKAANLLFEEIRWHLDLKRRWDHTRIYDSSGNGYTEFGPEATALIFYAMPLRQLYITGRGQKESLRFSDAEFDELVADRDFDASTASTQELVNALSKLRRRGKAAEALAQRMKATPDSDAWPAVIDQLLALAADPTAGPAGRSGACKALQLCKDRNRTTSAELKNAEIAKCMAGLLKDPDPYIRFGGVRVLQKLSPDEVRPYANDIMDAVIATGRPTFPLDEEDPVQWAHGQMGALLAEKVLAQGLEGLDRKRLLKALRSLLSTPDGGARNMVARSLETLTLEETLELADVIVDTVRLPAPANSMFDGAAEVSQNVLAKYRFEEALPLGVAYNPHSLGKTKLLEKYGPSALTTQSGRELMKAIGDMMLVEAVDGSDLLTDQILQGTSPETLNKLKRIDAVIAADRTLNLPAAKTELVAVATNFAARGKNETTYTWRKVYGAGEVAFTPNATAESRKTTVSFTGGKPGRYRFEVTMSDTLGYNDVTATVDVTLHDQRGGLPPNRPPQARSQSLKAVPGLPVRVTLSGTDPDGDDLGFIVTKPPAHGRLTGIGGDLIYIANYRTSPGQDATEKSDEILPPNGPSIDDIDVLNGPKILPLSREGRRERARPDPWADSFAFAAVDGQGEQAAGTIDFVVSDQDVGVVVYEGFDYPTGTVIGKGGGTSFGFDGPWRKSDGRPGESDFWVEEGAPGRQPRSFSYASLPSTGGKFIRGASHRHCLRGLDAKALSAHHMLEPGRELWFSLFVQGGRGRLSFGLQGPGEDADLGFQINGYEIHATLGGEASGSARNPWSRHAKLRFSEDGPDMIIGCCTWGKTETDPDTLEIYRVFDAPEFGPLILEKPAAVAEGTIPQETIRNLYLHAGSMVDEIRLGPTLHSVMLGTCPLTKSEPQQ